MSLSKDRKIAESCAHALFKTCEGEEGTLGLVYKGLRDIQSICKEDSSFFRFLCNPLFKIEQKRTFLRDLKLPRRVADFLDLIIGMHIIHLLPIMMEHFFSLYYTARHQLHGLVTVARSEILTDPFKRKITKKVEAVLGKKVDLSYAVDASLGEGFTLEAGTYFLDASLKGSLSDFKRYMGVA